MRLSVELRREIFDYLLLCKDAYVVPTCGGEPAKMENDRGIKCNPTADLMTLNKTICSEIATILYEERTFSIHVHEGIRDSGIELLKSGRQKLQYLDELSDKRFTNFISGEKFGFDRLKKIEILIYPSSEEDRLSRHIPINTYFMNLALCKLLDRGDGNNEKKNRIVSLTIVFMESEDPSEALTGSQHVIVPGENYWWDEALKKPRETSIHRLSNVEIALRPFSILKSHNLEVKLPANVCLHDGTIGFVEELKKVTTSNEYSGIINDLSTAQIEAARQAMQDHIFSVLYSNGKHTNILGLSEEELCEDENIRRPLSPCSKANRSPFKPNVVDHRSDEEVYDLNGYWESGLKKEDIEMQLAIQASLDSLKTELSAYSVEKSSAAGSQSAERLQCHNHANEEKLAAPFTITQDEHASSAQDQALGRFREIVETSDELNLSEVAFLSSTIAKNYTFSRIDSLQHWQPGHSEVGSYQSVNSAPPVSSIGSDLPAPRSMNLSRSTSRCEETAPNDGFAQDGGEHEIEHSPTVLASQDQTANETHAGDTDHDDSVVISPCVIREHRLHNIGIIPRTGTEQSENSALQTSLSGSDSQAFCAGAAVQGETGGNRLRHGSG